jgi:hypothetical protein
MTRQMVAVTVAFRSMDATNIVAFIPNPNAALWTNL